MTREDFFELYEKRLSEFIAMQKQKIIDNRDIGHIHLINKISDLNWQITNKANLLIPELLIEKNINPNMATIQGINIVGLASNLLLESSSIQLKLLKNYNKFTEKVLNGSYYEEHPNAKNNL